MQTNRQLLIRSRKNLAEQVQVNIDFENKEIHLIMNNGMEILVVESAVGVDIPISYTKKGEPNESKNCDIRQDIQ